MRSIRSRRVPLSLVLILATQASVQASEEVHVTNFPSLQRVEIERFPELQAVSVSNHPPVTSFQAWWRQRVAPLSPATDSADLERFHRLGTLKTEGYSSLGLSVVGRLSGTNKGALRLELVLLPDTPFIQEAWTQEGVLLLEQRVDLDLELFDKGLFQATAPPITLRFPRYLAFLRNHCVQEVDVDIYLQLGD